ncbi:TPA_asm: coat protein [ssRNA phage SRR7976299_19]|uniref:Coat protein n=1 Tax=ssRNA phage SRR7976299_19 TaxID=2786641 RepID=A0A8S5L4N5_9VIRU|nr:coat protein [ssRNA phage SRR7976299_19]DAD52656.1 TPA_asm: coat protein [ssRNA phage SRR7976299_19]
MFADPQTITLDGAGGTAKNLVKINQDNYGSEYYLADADGLSEYRLKIRHSKETVKAGANPVDRHNVELTQYVYPTTAVPNGRTRQIYVVLRMEPGDSLTAAEDLFEALPHWLTDANSIKLLGWES